MDRDRLPGAEGVSTARDFAEISPSAKLLLLVKSQTDLPFARHAAELLWGDQLTQALLNEAATPGAELRRAHFEARARSLDAALRSVRAKRILEIAGGLSFRGLAMAASERVYYADTDLPLIAAIKSALVRRMRLAPLLGTLQIAPLNALDRDGFRALVRRMPAGPIAIVEEGLLLYLDDTEKAQLAAHVREALLERGGVWVTADVYIRSSVEVFQDERARRFFERHRVEEKKFADWAGAERFFTKSGFLITERPTSSADPTHMRETWVLSPDG